MRWWDHAVCVGEPSETFYAPAHIGRAAPPYAKARAMCAGCPVRTECLDDVIVAESAGLRYGFVGGMSPAERDVEWRRRKRVDVLAEGA